jgi:hypothetical protein
MPVRHPIRVINGHRYSDYPVTEYVSPREWLALGVLLLGLAMWAAAMAAGVVWIVYQVVQRWR